MKQQMYFNDQFEQSKNTMKVKIIKPKERTYASIYDNDLKERIQVLENKVKQLEEKIK